jgi:cyclopropane fatty-acyl-phospholipid synthase-like methyltransferase
MATPQSTPEDIGRYYDQMSQFYNIYLGQNIHAGYWPTADDDTPLVEAQERLTDMMIERLHVRAGQRVLDVGCGVGGPAIRLARATNCTVVGINVSQSQIQQATQLAEAEGLTDKVQFRYADAMQLPFENTSFDGVWAFESIFHMPDRLHVLSEIARVLCPGGWLALTEPVEATVMTDQEKAALFPTFGIVSLVKVEQYPGLLKSAGFENIEVIDISKETSKTIPSMTKPDPQKQEKLLNAYGQEFMAMMGQNLPIVAEIHSRSLGYILAVGQKPLATR